MFIINYLENMRIGGKIYGGFALVLAVLLAIAGLSIFMNLANKSSFVDYRNAARLTNEAGRVQANMLSARLSFMKYQNNQSTEAAQELYARLDRAQESINAMSALAESPEMTSAISAFAGQVETYRGGASPLSPLCRPSATTLWGHWIPSVRNWRRIWPKSQQISGPP